jgi:hypothetical protein
MIHYADLAVYTPDGELLLVVEVKNKRNASPEWAAQMRRNLLVHGMIPATPYFLLALPEYFFLWKGARPGIDVIPPDYMIETAQALAPFVTPSTLPLNGTSEYGLQILVNSWLHQIATFDLSDSATTPAVKWLFDSELYQAIRNGTVALGDTR